MRHSRPRNDDAFWPTLPYHRLPADAHVPLRLAPGIFLLARDQTVQETEETAAYLCTGLVLVDAGQADNRAEQYRQSKGMNN